MAKKICKRMVEFKAHIKEPLYNAESALDILTKNAKNYESIDVAVVLNTDSKKSDQVVKGVVSMPAGLGKNVSIGIFAKTGIEQLKQAGADHVGFEDLIEQVKKGETDCDVFLASMEVMPELTKLGMGKILKGKMPNPKNGTAVQTSDLPETIKLQKAGQLSFRSNESIIHCSIGKAKFTTQDLLKNYDTLISAIWNARPTVVKAQNFIKRIFVTTTMGPSIKIDMTQRN